ncbi:alkaline phosphatase-like protein [Ramicandelaber brevisporus]|nr:alkaline phosphatase-like protein [Ramicandelaber brevisporus]
MVHLLLILLTVVASTAVLASATAPFLGIEHVLFIGIDGIGLEPLHRLLASNSLPNIASLRARGTYSDSIRGVRPTLSLPNWMALLSSGYPEATSVDDNGWLPSVHNGAQPIDPLGRPCMVFPTIFHVLRQKEPSAVTAVWYWWPEFNQIFRSPNPHNASDLHPLTVRNHIHVENDTVLLDAALDEVSKLKPRLSFIYIGDVDEEGHRTGYGPLYYEALRKADSDVGRIFATLDDNGMDIQTNTVVFVMTDHGRNLRDGGRSHGTFTTPELMTQLIVVGPPNVIASGQAVKEELPIPNVDVPATALALLGIEQPRQWSGRVIRRVITKQAWKTIRARQMEFEEKNDEWVYADESGPDFKCMHAPVPPPDKPDCLISRARKQTIFN